MGYCLFDGHIFPHFPCSFLCSDPRRPAADVVSVTDFCVSFLPVRLPPSLGLPLISQSTELNMGTQSGLDMLITFKYWFFLNTLSLVLLLFHDSSLTLFHASCLSPGCLILSKADFVVDRCLTWGVFSSTDAPLSFSFYSGARCLQRLLLWLINLLSDSKIYVDMCFFKQSSPFIYLGCI